MTAPDWRPRAPTVAEAEAMPGAFMRVDTGSDHVLIVTLSRYLWDGKWRVTAKHGNAWVSPNEIVRSCFCNRDGDPLPWPEVTT